MKKFLSAILAMTLLVVMAVPVCAEEITPNEGDSSKDVTASYTTTPDEVVHTYHVTVTWDVPSFTYNFQGTEYTWQTDTLNYKETGKTGEAKWDAETKNITLTVTNRSDMAINCSAALTKNSAQSAGFDAVYAQTGTDTGADAAITVADGAWKDYTAQNSGSEKTCNLSGTITVSGVPDKSVGILATITVTITK